MLKNYFKTAWRNLKEHKFHTFVNISGLAFGLATAILLLLWVQHEKSFDRFHKDYVRINRFTAQMDANTFWEGVPGPLAVFCQSLPEVESVVRIIENAGEVLATENRSTVIDGLSTAYVDSTFLTVFDFGLLKGKVAQLFPNPHSIVLTESTSKKIFGDDDPIGEVLQFGGDNFTVTGLMSDFPDNSSLAYDALLPMTHYGQQFTARGGNREWKTIDEDMGNFSFKTFVKMHDGINPEIITQKFKSYVEARIGETSLQFKLQPLADMHLVGIDGNNAPARMVQIFLLIAIMVLAIAAINYINLTTARALVRAREVGIRKIVGAGKVQLFLQFIVETVLLFSVALLVAIGLIVLLLPMYNNIAGKQLHFSLSNIEIWKVIGYSALGTLLAASIYPALLLSGFQPLQVMKGKMASGTHTALLRKILVVFQFSVSMILIVATLVISRQMTYMREMDLGYDKNYVFSVSLPDEAVKHIDALKNELRNHPSIVNVGLSDMYDITNADAGETGDIEWPGKPTDNVLIITQSSIDKDFIPTMGMQLLEGRNLTGTAADSNLYILNETAVREMGLTPPYVGTPISFHKRPGIIAGVVKDFNFKPLKEKISPLLFFHWWDGNRLYVRTTAAEASNAIKAVEQQYKKYAGDTPAPFKYNFVDEQFEAKYRSDQRAGLLFDIFAGIAIFISCLGLLGLSTYTVRQRVKEIGIRKVLGASVGSIVGLLSNGLLRLILISIILGTPIAWWAMNNWLDDFAYRIEIQWWMFVMAGFAALLIALLTVSWQAIRAAVANPVESLRDE